MEKQIFSVTWFLLNGGGLMHVLFVEALIVTYARNLNSYTKRHNATCVHFIILVSFYASG